MPFSIPVKKILVDNTTTLYEYLVAQESPHFFTSSSRRSAYEQEIGRLWCSCYTNHNLYHDEHLACDLLEGLGQTSKGLTKIKIVLLFSTTLQG